MPNVTVTLFASTAGIIVGVLALCGAASIATGIQEWLTDRLTLDLRHLRVHRKWSRPGAHVTLPDGREGAILNVYRGLDGVYKSEVAVVQTWDADECYDDEPLLLRLRDVSPPAEQVAA